MMKRVAFIPVRGGSRSIPLKNIKPLCGKPLVCWTIESLIASNSVEEIVVATDSKMIEDVVNSYSYDKVKLYQRLPENAADSSSTESVMLEYIERAGLCDDDIFVLVQATSPMTRPHHFSEALALYDTHKFDSVLSCVRSLRFFWSEDGRSLNYDYINRPRRQDFGGVFMENGAFYINTVKGIRESNNRLTGKIGIYEMPGYTATEIDELDDWIIIENLMVRHGLVGINKHVPEIKLFLSDIDGTLTDGGMYYSEFGDELKKFNTHDGMGIQLLQDAGIKTGIITSETRTLNERRANKLRVDYYVQGKKNNEKLEAVLDICQSLGISLNNVAYIGDDINCIELLERVGLAACPADATDCVKHVSGINIMSKGGGKGCVREFIDKFLLNDSSR